MEKEKNSYETMNKEMLELELKNCESQLRKIYKHIFYILELLTKRKMKNE